MCCCSSAARVIPAAGVWVSEKDGTPRREARSASRGMEGEMKAPHKEQMEECERSLLNAKRRSRRREKSDHV